MTTIGAELLSAAREAIESAGAEYIGIRGDSILFRDPRTDAVCSLYLFSATRTNVMLTLKAARERVRDFPALEPTEAEAIR
jgi:hypothetical protein